MNELDSIISKRGNFRVLDPYFLILWKHPYKIVPIIFSDNKYDEYFQLDNYQNRTTLSKMCGIKIEDFSDIFNNLIPDDYKYMIICDSIASADKNDSWAQLLDNLEEFDRNTWKKNKYIDKQYIVKDQFYKCIFKDYNKAQSFRESLINYTKTFKQLNNPDLWMLNGQPALNNLKKLDDACDKLRKEDKRITRFEIYPSYRVGSIDNADKYEIITRIDAHTEFIDKGRPTCEVQLKNLHIRPIDIENEFIKVVKESLTDERIKSLKEFLDKGDRWGWD